MKLCTCVRLIKSDNNLSVGYNTCIYIDNVESQIYHSKLQLIIYKPPPLILKPSFWICICLFLILLFPQKLQYIQGDQSRGQHDWDHGFPKPVKSFLSQISCGKVQKNTLIFFWTRLCQSFFSVCFSFPDYLDQLKKKRKILRDWVHTSVGRSNLENCSELRRKFYTFFCRRIWVVFFSL